VPSSLQVDKHVAPLPERGERVKLVEQRPLAVDDLVGLMLDHGVHQRVLVGEVVVQLRIADVRGREDVFVAGAGDAAAEHQLRCGNVKVPYFLTAALVPGMAERGTGVIVNVSTMVAGFGLDGMALYGSTKAALELLTKAWSAEFGPKGIRVNAVAPGPVSTEGTEGMREAQGYLASLAPARRLGTAQEIAAAIVYLASPEAAFTHGVVLPVDGGRVAV
jgi:NAD(P)-dependent dehydrogenase (short-subunit alcohol dehydrogenase family)